MKHLSIRFRITFWFTAALIVVVLFTYFVVFSVSNQIIQKTIRDNLIETVENNVDEVEFYSNIDDVDLNNDVDHFVGFQNGYLEVDDEVDDDFLDEVNEVYTALYSTDNKLIYGENPISRDVEDLKFVDSKIQNVVVGGTTYYVFDRKLTSKGIQGLWLRGIVSETQGSVQMSDISHVSLILLPILVLIASVGGYLIARRALTPIQRISETAKQIGQKNDLKRRIEIGDGNDEVHQLADSFNDMFEKLEKAFESERQFTSDASHELRTPMSVIAAQCEYSLEKRRSAEEYEEALKVIWRQSKKMSKLINDMLDFTRLEVHKERYPMECVNLTELVSSICSDMALIRDKNISLTCETQENIEADANRELFSRLLVNLISNAYRYGKEDGHIWVRLQRKNEMIRLEVEDDGIGIEKENQKKIFQRFYQTDASRSGSGMGLGLSMAYEIAKFHNGDIVVESEKDKGSIFTVLLPC